MHATPAGGTVIIHHELTDHPQLPLEFAEQVLAPRWAEAIAIETEGNQDTGWWEA